MIKTLIVDDSPLTRTILRNFLESDNSFKIIGEAENGRDGVEKALELNPDLITMDIEMPVMGGLDAISEIKKFLNTPIVVISTYDTAKMAYEATVKGAMEFYAKDIFTRCNPVKQKQILDTLKQISGIKGRIPFKPEAAVYKARFVENRKIDAVVIAASTGGPRALSQLYAALPGDFPVPIIMVQHNSSGFDKGFVQWLNACTPLEVRLAEAGERPLKGNIYVAPTGRHLVIEDREFLFNDEEPVNNQKPAADVLFKSAAQVYQNAVISVVLTGMGCDGAEGTRHIRKAGGITIAQDEESSMIYGMPKMAAETGCVDMVLPLDKIPSKLVLLTKG
ncbi:MAG: chemotaxis-specific protein-glutamate methyltransferase CheB [Treponema sp.]|jgi:two-component system chemotaxis response regulator CheB|nr:chemotaxis-specific protein-glutamate methyltransferase CheB [Treponema sp.]